MPVPARLLRGHARWAPGDWLSLVPGRVSTTRTMPLLAASSARNRYRAYLKTAGDCPDFAQSAEQRLPCPKRGILESAGFLLNGGEQFSKSATVSEAVWDAQDHSRS
jgi:hypothetical protein